MQKEDQQKIVNLNRLTAFLGAVSLLLFVGGCIWAFVTWSLLPCLLVVAAVIVFFIRNHFFDKIEEIRSQGNFYTGRK